MARWKDTNFWSVRNMVDKTRKVLHKTLREYKKVMSVSCRPFFVDEGAEGGDGKQSIELCKVLLKPRTPSEAVSMKSVKNLKGEEVGSFEEMKVTWKLYNVTQTVYKTAGIYIKQVNHIISHPFPRKIHLAPIRRDIFFWGGGSSPFCLIFSFPHLFQIFSPGPYIFPVCYYPSLSVKSVI